MPVLDLEALEDRIEKIYHEHTLRWRRHLHAHPDLSNEEKPTADYIEQELRRMDKDGILTIRRLQPNAVVVDLHGRGGDGPMIALRSDHDALPITEETGEPFCSTTPGVMHACGHDSHTAMNLSAVLLLLDDVHRLRGSVRFIFQHAEEACGRNEGGATKLIEAGVLDGVKMIFGLHMIPDEGYPTGTVGIRCGTMLHSTDCVTITLRGPGGHSSQPYNTVDLVAASAQILVALSTMVTRRFRTALAPLLTFCSIHTKGTATNVISTELVMRGSLRTTDPAVREKALECIPEVAKLAFYSLYPEAMEPHHGRERDGREYGEVEVSIIQGAPCTVNHPDAYAVTAKILPTLLGGQEKVRVMALPLPPSEDFSEYARRIPGNFSLIGCRNDAKGCSHALHSSQFTLDEEAMKVGIKVHFGHVFELLIA